MMQQLHHVYTQAQALDFTQQHQEQDMPSNYKSVLTGPLLEIVKL